MWCRNELVDGAQAASKRYHPQLSQEKYHSTRHSDSREDGQVDVERKQQPDCAGINALTTALTPK
jgi:hypothetical protein